MRVDSIDLIGDFKIQGQTGSSSQALGLSGGSLNWIEVSGGGGGGSTEGLIKSSGYNYVIVQANTDEITNGSNLIQAYSEAVTLSSSIGGASLNNRVAVLLSPGIYDLNGQYLDLTTSFVDLIAISTNPLATKIKSTGAFNLFNIGSNIDIAIENVWLDSDLGLFIYDGGIGSGNYLRWKNLVLRGNGFYSGGSYSLNDMDGHFENIKYQSPDPSPSTEYFAAVQNNLNGIYKNIDLGNVNQAFWSLSGNIHGTFSEIINKVTSGNIFYSDSSGSISGRFENFNLHFDAASSFYIQSGGSIDGTFKNIHVSGSASSCFYGPITNNSYFENIYIEDTSSYLGDCFVNSNGSLGGIYRNIKVGNIGGRFLCGDTSGSQIYLTCSNISVGDVTNDMFGAGGSEAFGTYENIYFKNIGGDFFNAGCQGKFKNIYGGNVGNDCFSSATNDFSGIFQNINIGNVTGAAFGSTNMYGVYKDIKFGDVLSQCFYTSGSNYGKFKRIFINSAINFSFFAATDLNCDIENLEILLSNGQVIGSSGNISGTFSNIHLHKTSASTFTGVNLDSKVSNLRIHSTFNTSEHLAAGNNITGTYRNITITGDSDSIFKAGYDISPYLVDNVEVDTCNKFVISQVSSIDGKYKNIKCNTVTTSAFRSDVNLFGTYSNIQLDVVGDIFYAHNSGVKKLNIDGLVVGTASTMLLGSSTNNSSTKINKLKFKGNFQGFNISTTKTALGSISNSEIDMIGTQDYLVLDGVIERSKILTDSGNDSISVSGTSQLFYLITNEGQNTEITTFTYGTIISSSITR